MRQLSVMAIASLCYLGAFLLPNMEAVEAKAAFVVADETSLSHKFAVGIVVDPQDNPVVNATVAVETGEVNNRQLITTQTVADGSFELAYEEVATSPVRTLWVYAKQYAIVATSVGERRHHRIVLPAAEPCEYCVRPPEGYSLTKAALRPYAIRLLDGAGRVAVLPDALRNLLEVKGDEQHRFVLLSAQASALQLLSVRQDDFGEQVFQAEHPKLQVLPAGRVEVHLDQGERERLQPPKVTLWLTRPDQPFTDYIPPTHCIATCRPKEEGVYQGFVAVGRVWAQVLVPNDEHDQPVLTAAKGRLEAGETLTIQVGVRATTAISGVAVGEDGEALANVILNIESTGQPSIAVRTDQDGRFRCRVVPGEFYIEVIDMPKRLLNRYVAPQLTFYDVGKNGRVGGNEEFRVKFPFRQFIAGRIVDADGLPAGKHLRIEGYFESDLSKKMIEGVVDAYGQFNAATLVEGAKEAMDRCEFFVSEDPSSNDTEVRSQQACAKLKVITLSPLVLQLEK